MSDAGLQEFLAAFYALPLGVFFGETQPAGETKARKYLVRRQSWSAGKSHKLIAEELGGSDYISLNLYHLASGPALRPCEMPEEKVLRFVLALRVIKATKPANLGPITPTE